MSLEGQPSRPLGSNNKDEIVACIETEFIPFNRRHLHLAQVQVLLRPPGSQRH